MVKVNVLKGYWQLACAKQIMTNAWTLVKKKNFILSLALKKSWKELKSFINSVSNSYSEYKYKLIIEHKTVTLTFKNDNLDEVVDTALEKIAEIKGKQFIYNISERIFCRYDFLINKLKTKGALTFTENVFICKLK